MRNLSGTGYLKRRSKGDFPGSPFLVKRLGENLEAGGRNRAERNEGQQWSHRSRRSGISVAYRDESGPPGSWATRREAVPRPEYHRFLNAAFVQGCTAL